MKRIAGIGFGLRLVAGAVAVATWAIPGAVAQDSSMMSAPVQAAAPAPAKPAAAKPAVNKPKPASTDSAAKPDVKPVATAAAATAPAAQKPVETKATVTGSIPTSAPTGGVAGKNYYIEFRSRSAQSYGHTFAVHGRLNGTRTATKTVVGLHPATESPVPWMIGHVVLVPSETGASDGDTEDEYVTARFRVVMNEAEYRRLMGFVSQLKAKSPVWHAVLYNCNAFVGDIARFMGMETPGSTMLMPEDYINGLRDANINRQSANLLGTPVKVESAQALRASALRQKGARRAAVSSPPASPSSNQ